MDDHEKPNPSSRKPYKVLQLTTQSGTAYRFAMPIAKYLRQEGYDVSLGCSEEPQADVPSFHREIRDEGFPLEIIPIPRKVSPLCDLKALFGLIKLLKEKKYDFLHTHNSKAGIIGRLAAKIAGLPHVIHTNHGLPFFKVDKFSFIQSIIFWTMEAFAARLSDRILAVSKAEFEKAEKFLIAKPPKLVNVGQGLRTDYYSTSAVSKLPQSKMVEELKEKLQDKMVLGSVGRLVSEKGIDVLIEAVGLCVTEHPDLIVIIVGEGEERPALEKKVNDLKLDSHFIFLGAITDQDEVRQLYTLMDIFVLPTRWESFGMVFAEAMALEIPVIGTKMEPITTVVADGVTGLLITPDDVKGFAGAIRELVIDPEKRETMGQAGRQRVLDLWDEEKMVARIEKIYKDLL